MVLSCVNQMMYQLNIKIKNYLKKYFYNHIILLGNYLTDTSLGFTQLKFRTICLQKTNQSEHMNHSLV